MQKYKTKIELFISSKVKEFRLKNNMSQAELAHKLNLSSGFIGKVESTKSKSKYNLNHLNSLAKIFNCSIKDFFPDKHL